MSVEFNLDTHNKYSKYDSKVSENLAKYLDIYGINPQHFNKKSFAKEKDIDLTWKMFDEKYDVSLKELKKIVKKVHKYEISLGEIDYIIWYTQK